MEPTSSSAPEQPTNAPAPPAAQPAHQAHSQQTASTNVLAIIGFVLAWLPGLYFFGFILSIIGLLQAKNHGGKGKGLSIAGIILSVIFGIGSILIWIFIIAAGSAADKAADQAFLESGGTTISNGGSISGSRADAQVEDIEIAPGQSATIEDMKMTLSNVKFATSLGRFDNADAGKTYVTADILIENSGSKTQPYNVYDFRVQTPSGQVLDGAYASLDNPLNSGDLVSGGKVNGQIVFEIPVEDGKTFIIWKPSYFSAKRAVVSIK